jgi:hypothetical protein
VQEPPKITCPANITLNVDGASVQVNYPNPTVTGGALKGCVPASGSVFPLGTTLVTCTATNSCGTNTCTFSVTVQQVICATNNGVNLVMNPGFEVTSPIVAPNNFNQTLDPNTGVPGWTTAANKFLEVWCNTFSGIPAQSGTNQLEINALSKDETVSQAVTGLNTNCSATLCFYYTGRYPNKFNNSFSIAVAGSPLLPVTLNPEDYSVGGWQFYSVTFTPSASTITIQFRGFPADGNTAGAHIDNVMLTQGQPPAITCPADITLNVAGTGATVNYANPAVTGGGLKGCIPPSGSVFPLGTTVVTCTATNGCGSNTCTFNVTVQQVTCTANGNNLVLNPSFEVTSPIVAPNTFNNALNPTTGVPGWTTAATNFLEVWGNIVGGIPASLGTNQLEINAQNGDETVSQVITNLNTNCVATLCFDYTGRFPNQLNNKFQIIVTGSGLAPVTLTPVFYAVGGWQRYSVAFVPTSTTITIQFHGIPADGSAGGAHIDNVLLTQGSPLIVCPASITTNICGSSVAVTYPNPTVTGGGIMSIIPPSGTVFQLGTSTVTCTATNPCGTNTCTFTVTVTQIAPIAMTCPANITTNICGNSVVVNYSSPTVTGGALKSVVPASGSIFPLGTTVVTCTATNACSTNTCTFNVTVLQSPNRVINGSFEVTSPIVAPNNSNQNLNPTTGVPGWTTAATNFLEVWCNTVGGIPASLGTNQLEINAQSADETVSQVITNLNTNCLTTLCFDYTGRFGVVGGTYNNDFTLELSGGYSSTVAFDPATYSVGGWKNYCTSFVPTTPTVTIAFHGHPHFSDGTPATQGGGHIDNVSLVQCCDSLPCPPNSSLQVAVNGANIVLTWTGPSYHLQGASSLSSSMVWVNVPGTSPVTLPTSGPLRYFRLVCP